MTQKSPKIVFFAILSLAVFSFDFDSIGAGFSSVKYTNKSASFISKVQAKKRPAKKRKKKVGKLSQKSNNLDFQNPVIVSGNDICQKNSEEALKILSDRNVEDFNFVASNLGKIECAVSGSGVYPWEDPPRFKVGVATSNAEPVWYASVLVHESCHIEQYKKGAGKKPSGNVSAEEYSGEKAEIACLGAQLESLKKLEASQSKIDYVASIAQSRYWLVDIGQRWW